MIKVGITGGIGSGKTTFCKVWEKLGVYVVYADDFAKQLMTRDRELIQKIKNTFGENSYLDDGSLNRKFLAEEAFIKDRVKELNGIVHPILWKRMVELENKKELEGIHFFAREAAILLNNGRPKELDVVILILTNQAERIKRVRERDRIDEQAILGRIDKQPDFEHLTHEADYVVRNNSTLLDLENLAEELFREISKRN